MGKFRPLPEPVRLQDLLYFARSRTEKKLNNIMELTFQSLTFVRVKKEKTSAL